MTYQIIQTINHQKSIRLTEFDDLALAENFLVKYKTILQRHDPQVKFDGTTLTTTKPIWRQIKIVPKK